MNCTQQPDGRYRPCEIQVEFTVETELRFDFTKPTEGVS